MGAVLLMLAFALAYMPMASRPEDVKPLIGLDLVLAVVLAISGCKLLRARWSFVLVFSIMALIRVLSYLNQW